VMVATRARRRRKDRARHRPLIEELVEGSNEPETLHPRPRTPGYFDGCPDYRTNAANVQLNRTEARKRAPLGGFGWGVKLSEFDDASLAQMSASLFEAIWG
jgi:hypothetical protein